MKNFRVEIKNEKGQFVIFQEFATIEESVDCARTLDKYRIIYSSPAGDAVLSDTYWRK